MKSDKTHRIGPETIEPIQGNHLPRRWNPRKWLKDEVRAFVSSPWSRHIRLSHHNDTEADTYDYQKTNQSEVIGFQISQLMFLLEFDDMRNDIRLTA